jgi:DNA gyrase subunit A
LKQALKVFIEHRFEVVRRRSEYDLARAQERAHILEGLLIALRNLDEVVQLIRKAADADAARTKLMTAYELSQEQANAILDMPLRRLAALERRKIEDEHKDLQAQIKGLESLLASPKKMRTTIAGELKTVQEAYADRRRTQIVTAGKDGGAQGALTARELEVEKMVWVGVDAQGRISRSVENKPPRPSGKDAPALLLQVSTRDTLFVVAESGLAAVLAVHALPETTSLDKGEPLARVSALKVSDSPVALFALPPKEKRPAGFVLTASVGGMLKKSEIAELPGAISQSFRLAKLKSGDRLLAAWLSDGKGEVLFASAGGMAIRFREDEVRPTGLASAGVNGIKLGGKEEAVGALPIDPNEEIFLMLSNGRAKRVKVGDFPVQGRYGKGVIAWKLGAGERLAGVANQKGTTRATVQLKLLAAKSLRLDEALVVGRQANGKELLEMKEGDEVLKLVTPG